MKYQKRYDFSKKILVSEKIYIALSKISQAGRGVFAKTEIGKEELIEVCPTIEIPKVEIEILENSCLTSYIYFFGKDKDRMFLPLGFGAIYNHSRSPNAKYVIHPGKKLIEFFATKEIKKDEEIVVNYLQNITSLKPLWFE